MSSYVALLRGVNLAGRTTLRMAELKALAEGLGLEQARTFIASGNLLFRSPLAEEELRVALEERVGSHIKREVRVILRTSEEMEAVVLANPFTDAAANNVQAFFMNEPPPPDLLATIRNRAEDERVATGQREVFVAYGLRGIGKSRLRIPAAEAGTARNMNTVARLAELAREMS